MSEGDSKAIQSDVKPLLVRNETPPDFIETIDASTPEISHSVAAVSFIF